MDEIKVWVVSREEIEYDEKDFRLFYKEEDALKYTDIYPEYKLRLGVSKGVRSIYEMLNNKDKYLNEDYKGNYIYYKCYVGDKPTLRIGIIDKIYKSKVKYVCGTGTGRCYCCEKKIDSTNCRFKYMDVDYGGGDMADHIVIRDLNYGGFMNFYFVKYNSDLNDVEDDSYLLNVKPKEKKVNNYVYFIQETMSKAIKIGTTTNVKNRFSQLQTSSPLKLNLLKVMKGDSETESKLHKMFARYRMSGEWFEMNDELIDYIDKVKGLKVKL